MITAAHSRTFLKVNTFKYLVLWMWKSQRCRGLLSEKTGKKYLSLWGFWWFLSKLLHCLLWRLSCLLVLFQWRAVNQSLTLCSPCFCFLLCTSVHVSMLWSRHANIVVQQCEDAPNVTEMLYRWVNYRQENTMKFPLMTFAFPTPEPFFNHIHSSHI